VSAATSGILERRLKSRPITDPAYRAMMNLQIAFVHFEADFAAVVGAEQLSTSAFNVLRILKGHPEGHPRGEIATRLIYRNADVTRIIDRLTRRGLVERARSRTDRRLSVTRLTPKGHKLMARLDAPVAGMIERFRTRLPAHDFVELSRCLEALYVDILD
jgi:DNA-binding MarR family transcriptional regulator